MKFRKGEKVFWRGQEAIVRDRTCSYINGKEMGVTYTLGLRNGNRVYVPEREITSPQKEPKLSGSQLRRHSALEALLNTLSGFAISYLAGLFIFPAFGLPITHGQNFGVVSAYTIISLVRSYVWRRLFNHFHARKA